MSASPRRLRGRATELTDRLSERAELDRLVDTVRGGESGVLVVHGDPGVGKTVLLDHLAGQASDSGCRVARNLDPERADRGGGRCAAVVPSR